jgi:hypothetical protein
MRVGHSLARKMFAAPYVSWLVWAVAGLYVSFTHADTVNRDRRAFYCSADYHPFSTAMGVFVALLCVVILGFQGQLMLSTSTRRLRLTIEHGCSSSWVSSVPGLGRPP